MGLGALNSLTKDNQQSIEKIKSQIEEIFQKYIEKLNSEKSELFAALQSIEDEK
jgi:hypothetical protein